MRIASLACLAAMALAGCGGGDGDNGDTARTPSTDTTAMARPPGPGPGARPDPQLVAGRRVLEQSGCLACHQIGATGNSGPGNNLEGIGARRTPAQIERALTDSPAPMPSFAALPSARRDALVAYLAALRGCPEGSDCG